MGLAEKFSEAKHEVLGFISRADRLHLYSLVYLLTIGYVFSHGIAWLDNINLAVPLAIFSVALVICGYSRCKEKIDTVFSNEIIKWVFTVFIYSCCLWFAKWKINIDYGITPDNINYSAISYALILLIPMTSLVCAIVSYAYIYLNGISFERVFISSFVSLAIVVAFSNQLDFKSDFESYFVLAIVIISPYLMINIIPLFKRKWVFGAFLESLSLLSVSVALFIVCILSLVIASKTPKYLLFLDSYATSSCNSLNKDGFYLRKNDDQCYKIVFDDSKKLKLVLIDAKK